MSAAAAGASGTNFIQPPNNASPTRGLTQHPIIANVGNAAGQRWFNAAIANPALECLESSQSRQGIRGMDSRLDEMNKVSSSSRSER